MTIFEPKFILTNGAVPPDSYDDSFGLVPPDDFVVSRNRDFSVASHYGDMVWDLSSYDPDGRSSLLRFPYWDVTTLTPEREVLSQETHWLMFLLIWKQETPLSYSSHSSYLILIRQLTKFSEKNCCRIKDVLTDAASILRFVDSGIPGYLISMLSFLLSTLARLGVEQTGLEVPHRAVSKELSKRVKEFNDDPKQCPPIPTRIYSEIISGLTKEILDFETVADRYLALVELCSSDPLIGRGKPRQYVITGKLTSDLTERSPDFQELLQRYDLHDYFFKKKLPCNTKGLSTGLAFVQKTAKLLIQAYSGMRDAEGLSLPYHCIETSISNGKCHYLILGRTTKLNKGRIKRVRWVTNKEGHSVIKVARRIADTIYKTLGEQPINNNSRISKYPLFPSTSYLPIYGKRISSANGGGIYLSSLLSLGSLAHFEKIKSQFIPLIEESDIHELENIDPHRAWRTEAKFNIGALWPLTSHQLRRSLALYAQRSGLVSLPSLRRQLQHLKEEMSCYYARGSAFAKDFIGDDKDHFGREWQNMGPISSALSYTRNVLNSDEVLFGGHVDWIKKSLLGEDGAIIVDREETLLRFKRGELAYKETFLGGCTNTGECKQTALKWLDVDCLVGCINLVGSLAKLERAMIAQTRLVDSINPNSIEYLSEKADLDVLISTHSKVISQQKLKEEAL